MAWAYSAFKLGRRQRQLAEQLKEEIAVLDDALRAYEQDIQKLQHRLREARSRQTQIAARLESAENRVKLRTLMTTERTDEALSRFDQLERRVDEEGRFRYRSVDDTLPLRLRKRRHQADSEVPIQV